MGAYIPGMEEHDAINNSDGFTTGFLGDKSKSGVNPVPPQGFLNNTQQSPMQNTQQMPMQNNGPMPVPNPGQRVMLNGVTPKQMPKQPKIKINTDIGQMTGVQIKEGEINNASRIIHIISIVIMISLIVFIALYLTGKINPKKATEEPEGDVAPVVDLEKEKIEKIITRLNTACNNLDDEGNYGAPTAVGEEKCSDLICYLDENVMCQGKLCMLAIEDKVYTRDCSTGNNRVANKYDFQANVNLGDACNVLIENPGLNGSIQASYGTCVDYQCVTELGGKLYERNCRENS